MIASKILHKGKKRIKVNFPYNAEIASRIKQIPDARWSATHRAWHIPYTKKSFDQLKSLFPDVEYSIKVEGIKVEPDDHPVGHPNLSGNVATTTFKTNKGVSIMVFGRKIAIKLPKNELDTRFILGLRFCKWDAKQFCWVVPNYPGNLDLIKDYFKDRVTELVVHEEFLTNVSPTAKRTISKNDLLIIKTNNGRLRLIFTFNKDLTKAIKNIPFNNWDIQNKWWSIPFSEKFLTEIKYVAASQNLNLIFEQEVTQTVKKAKVSAFDIPNYRPCPDEYILKLTELRYSPKTIGSYKSMFEEFINYYHTVDIKQIDEPMITAFLRYLVIERKVSISYQNQAINAVKFYYERVLGGQRKVYLVDRPRHEKRLPTVLSEQEVAEILKATENIKHKAILMLAYSAGLRISELINVKLNDIDSKRMQIRIEQAKGKKDRYTLLSPILLNLLREYFVSYKPKEFLFEGATGGKYSQRSIQSIMRNSVAKAGIKKWVSIHTLRHSFATHLLENGTDLRYIQSLLGHENSKTTEIYTHITTKGFDQIKSPLDRLDIFG